MGGGGEGEEVVGGEVCGRGGGGGEGAEGRGGAAFLEVGVEGL